MRYLFFFLLIILFSHCRQEKNRIPNFEFYPAIPDSADIKKKFFAWRIAETQYYNLDTIFSGSKDSIVIRFWPSYVFATWNNLFEFRFDNNEWKGFHYVSLPYKDDPVININGHKLRGDSVFIVKQITPKCGWDKFYDSLIFFQLRGLPTQWLIKDFKVKPITDGYGYTFEIATKNSYRNIQYSNPAAYQYKECQQIEELVGMIIRQLEDDYYWPLKNYEEPTYLHF